MLTIHTLDLLPESPQNRSFPEVYLLVMDGAILTTDVTAPSTADSVNDECTMRWLPESEAPRARDHRQRIGIINGKYTGYVLSLAPDTNPNERLIETGNWLSPRALFPNLGKVDFDVLSRALQLTHWSQNHRFCGQCGQPTTVHPTEPATHCTPCNALFYPRISPCIIVIVTRGDYCLLAHHTRYAQGFYSTLAGFVEAGESLEQALHREVMEEVGLTIDQLEYFGSQSWPFPGQMMVGFIANYVTGDIVIDEDEISDARWFHYTDLPALPGKVSISGQLIEEFVQRCQTRSPA